MGNKWIPIAPGKVYHVYTHGNADDNIFKEEKNYYRFLEKYNQYIPVIAHTFAYCLMPNHFHLLIMIKQKNELITFYSKKYKQKPLEKIQEKIEHFNVQQFSNLLNSYAKYYYIKYNRRGSLFINNIKRKLIENRQYFLNALNYIHFNPVMHAFVADISEYNFSSYHYYIDRKDKRINSELANKLFPKNPNICKPGVRGLGRYVLDMGIIF